MAFRSIKRFSCISGLLVSLSSCQRDATVTIVGTDTKPEFLVEASGGSTCVSRLLVRAVDAGGKDGPTVWGIGLIFGRGDADCRAKLVYGQTLPGYETDIDPKPLVAGQRYRVSVNGAGWMTTTEWMPR
jgi:hypothetical protein